MTRNETLNLARARLVAGCLWLTLTGGCTLKLILEAADPYTPYVPLVGGAFTIPGVMFTVFGLRRVWGPRPALVLLAGLTLAYAGVAAVGVRPSILSEGLGGPWDWLERLLACAPTIGLLVWTIASARKLSLGSARRDDE